ncbi:MAG: chemotaxis protein CheW [Woeseia sp.]
MTALATNNDDNAVHGDARGAGDQYLTFMLAGEEYGVEILKVQEIKGWGATTPIPNTPAYVLGVLNLRGAVVPIVDLRQLFGLESVEYGPTTVVIVVKMACAEQERTVGLVVDAVADVYRFESDEVQPPPEMGTAINIGFVRGLATVQEKMVIVLDVDSLIDFRALQDRDKDLAPVASAAAASKKDLQ